MIERVGGGPTDSRADSEVHAANVKARETKDKRDQKDLKGAIVAVERGTGAHVDRVGNGTIRR